MSSAGPSSADHAAQAYRRLSPRDSPFPAAQAARGQRTPGEERSGAPRSAVSLVRAPLAAGRAVLNRDRERAVELIDAQERRGSSPDEAGGRDCHCESGSRHDVGYFDREQDVVLPQREVKALNFPAEPFHHAPDRILSSRRFLPLQSP